MRTNFYIKRLYFQEKVSKQKIDINEIYDEQKIITNYGDLFIASSVFLFYFLNSSLLCFSIA